MPPRLFAACLLLVPSLAVAGDPAPRIEEELPGLLKFYTELHAAPELSGRETQTAAKLAAAWRDAGFEVTSGVGGTGVVGVLKNGDGPALMLRCDLDALPVTEATGLPFASTVAVPKEGGGTTGVMHACGHDLHMTAITGAGRYLAAHRDQWAGTLLLIGQPAEETGAGARAMLEDGLFERFPKPDFALALHVDPASPAGTVSVLPGYALANVDSVDVTFHGRGGHGAQPHTTLDPVVMAAEFILSAQAIVAREIDPRAPAVVTVGSVHAGSKHNIIPGEAQLQLTVRSYTDEVRDRLLQAIERRANGVASAAGAPAPTVAFSEGTPALYNDDPLTARVRGLFAGALGEDAVRTGEPSMGGEDFARYGRAGVPILMTRLGSVAPRDLARYEAAGVSPPSLHSPTYAPAAEPALRTGLTALLAAARGLLPAE